VDPHTADGIKAGLEHREADVPLVCLETARPAKFADTIREALGQDPERPPAYRDVESKPLRFDVMEPGAENIKRYIADRAHR
jgi:threonine synthase